MEAKIISETKPQKSTSVKKKNTQALQTTAHKPNVISKKAVVTKAVKEIRNSNKGLKKSTNEKNYLKIIFNLRYSTQYGQNIFITANHPAFGNGSIKEALPLQYFNENTWFAELNLCKEECINEDIIYNYFIKNEDGTISYDWGSSKKINFSKHKGKLLLLDAWNYAGYFENAFFTEPFQQVLIPTVNYTPVTQKVKKGTHCFKVKAPLLQPNETLCLLGGDNNLHNWDTENPIIMERRGMEYSVAVDLSNTTFPITYKYGVYNFEKKHFVYYEQGNNRVLYDVVEKNKATIINDAFAALPNTNWKGAGVAIPVFSLKTENSFGIGEFTDIKKLVDWCKITGQKLIQILPINDTTATHTNADSYPYAAISAFALHPIYLNLSTVVTTEQNKTALQKLESKRKELNNLSQIDYEAVLTTKWDFIKKIYPTERTTVFSSKGYKDYFQQNKHWLVPYAVFCYLRDEYGTANYNNWPAYKIYSAEAIQDLIQETSAAYNDIAIHYFVQYHLHLQLKDATQYAHNNSIIVKGDIPIGIYRYGTDAWQNPSLYNMHVQAGAPPDDFAIKGQNWGFPTYNWQKMKEDGFAWWKQRFEQMSYYFDAFRIDHILGFFRIWSIPIHAVEGILGYFVPAIPIHINELAQKGISFDYHRFTQPFINDAVLAEIFDNNAEHVKQTYLDYDGFGNYTLKPNFKTQVQVEEHFATLESSEHNKTIKQGLFDLISNVILFEVEGSSAQQFHFRFNIQSTTSYKHLSYAIQQALDELYVNYFFRRQDNFWKQEALEKLPALKRVTNMLICGEDLGLVPNCVPDVMRQLGLLSLEIQRMPKDAKRSFFHPNDAPYLSVVTPSTHDMSTIRGWWEEDKQRTQAFYNNELGMGGEAPFYCEPWINKAIVVQHLYSPAMWSIFQLQDILGIDGTLRRENPLEERINIPANPKHYWCYRMHITLETLLQATDFNEQYKRLVQLSGR